MTKSDALRKLVEHARREARRIEKLGDDYRDEPAGIRLLKEAKAWEEAAQWIERNAPAPEDHRSM